jgi:hypothetical protein
MIVYRSQRASLVKSERPMMAFSKDERGLYSLIEKEVSESLLFPTALPSLTLQADTPEFHELLLLI